jgi:hypothetical protein
MSGVRQSYGVSSLSSGAVRVLELNGVVHPDRMSGVEARDVLLQRLVGSVE